MSAGGGPATVVASGSREASNTRSARADCHAKGVSPKAQRRSRRSPRDSVRLSSCLVASRPVPKPASEAVGLRLPAEGEAVDCRPNGAALRGSLHCPANDRATHLNVSDEPWDSASPPFQCRPPKAHHVSPATGTTSRFRATLRTSGVSFPKLRLFEGVAGHELPSAFDMDAIAPEALPFQTGYLRPSARRRGATDRCPADWLGYPNRDEVPGPGPADPPRRGGVQRGDPEPRGL